MAVIIILGWSSSFCLHAIAICTNWLEPEPQTMCVYVWLCVYDGAYEYDIHVSYYFGFN